MRPTVSVVIAVYNGEAYFARAIPSILGQTYEDFELILVDDGSTDRTPQLLRSLSDPRVRVLSPGRIGFAQACNLGIAQAKGQYIARQDFDDRSYPNRLALQVERLEKDTGLGMVGGHYVSVDETRRERYIRELPTEHDSIVRAMAHLIPFAHTVVTFRRNAWVKARGYPETRNAVDIRLWIRFAQCGWGLANLPAVVGEHYIHASSWFNRAFTYRQRQRDLAMVQAFAIWSLRLPPWLYLYPLVRLGYGFAPTGVKRKLRRTLHREMDMPYQVAP
jgi:glycosyltransferase involved in cell wall biosynthesis